MRNPLRRRTTPAPARHLRRAGKQQHTPAAPLPDAPRMTFPRALRSELLRLARSPLLAAHVACGLAGGVACGAYFSVARWDTALGADAYAQFLGAMMPLMTGIACGLAVDEERRAGQLANLTALPHRATAVLAKLAALVISGALALALAFGVFGAILAGVGRLTVSPLTLLAAGMGALAGSLTLYALALWLALRFGRNVAIGVGAAGLLLAFFSVGGLAHGLMTGELTGAAPAGVLGFLPFSWAARLASLGIEGAIAAARSAAQVASVKSAAAACAVPCAVLSLVAVAALAWWFCRFEDGRTDA